MPARKPIGAATIAATARTTSVCQMGSQPHHQRRPSTSSVASAKNSGVIQVARPSPGPKKSRHAGPRGGSK
jgi:hypothetical protein